MKKIKLTMVPEYIIGHLRYGYYEGEITVTDEEYEQLRKNPLETATELDLHCDLQLYLEDYSVDDIGPFDHIVVELISEE